MANVPTKRRAQQSLRWTKGRTMNLSLPFDYPSNKRLPGPLEQDPARLPPLFASHPVSFIFLITMSLLFFAVLTHNTPEEQQRLTGQKPKGIPYDDPDSLGIPLDVLDKSGKKKEKKNKLEPKPDIHTPSSSSSKAKKCHRQSYFLHSPKPTKTMDTLLAQQIADAVDRTKGAMMLDMPMWFRLEYGRTCTTTRQMCARCSRLGEDEGEVSRVAECWLCAMIGDETKMCEPVPGFGEQREGDGHEFLCPKCRARAVVGNGNGPADGGGCEYEVEMRRERKVNDQKRVEEAMRRERETNDRKRVEKDRQRRAKISNTSASAASSRGGREMM
ncbi:hypothetical protein EPUS_04090 [Endocarpon pusillum Z07020]|uniref:Uncharacterized protein n=1 Tax=Endocarpon pusillum (strain Z07020 / HMAS-L-300199) TaxID=1263415 RepID=U1G7Q6_ENDPU|nr:uncharacterized protein EPUS_04090 [Endocarpon pusillum Z07020]ERF73467.1 hypothetical protein EPUS_04090 [Endocarpon pusillum Z07020]